MKSPLQEYLSYYNSLQEPGFAVLITGEWGVGKSHQVKNALSNNDRHYISLFGLNSTDEIHTAVFAEISPKKNKFQNVLAKLANGIGSMGGTYKIALPISAIVNSLLKETNIDRTLIFDDLERCGLGFEKTIGAINSYVEQKKCRVCIIAHDEKLDEKFGDNKEKLIGHSIKVRPEISEAYKSFVGEVSDTQARKFLTKKKKNILKIFEEGQCKSLRVLRHIIQDLGRLYDCLDEQILLNSEAVLELIFLFVAFDIEYQSGKIKEADLTTRVKDLYRLGMMRAVARRDGAEETNEPPLAQANEKYVSIDLRSELLSDDLLTDIFVDGVYSPEKIQKCIKNSNYFIDPTEAPAWKIISSFDKLEDEIVQTAIKKLSDDLGKHQVLNPGEILHSFSMLFLMALIEETEKSIDEIKAEFISYVDQLFKLELLEKCNSRNEWYNNYGDSYGGYSYWIAEDFKDAFYECREYLFDKCEEAFIATFPDVKLELFDYMSNKPAEFAQKISYTDEGDHMYVSSPIFVSIEVEEFVKAWLETPKENWRVIGRAFETRYQGRQLDKELSSEKTWLQEVKTKLEEKADELGGFQAYRIRRIISFHIEKCLPSD